MRRRKEREERVRRSAGPYRIYFCGNLIPSWILVDASSQFLVVTVA